MERKGLDDNLNFAHFSKALFPMTQPILYIYLRASVSFNSEASGTSVFTVTSEASSCTLESCEFEVCLSPSAGDNLTAGFSLGIL